MSNLDGSHFVAVEVLSLSLSNNQSTWHDRPGDELPPPQSATEPFASGLRADDKHQRGVQAGYERTTSISEECKRATTQ